MERGALPHPRFRSVETWQTALLTLPDTSYFELVRSVFGNIKTPFNKHRLMEDLASFLSRQDIQDALRAYLDLGDHRIIAAIGALHEPVQEDLERFFAGEYTFVELHTMLLNLEERLLLYRLQEEGKRRLTLNPLLAPLLTPLLEDTSVLFPSEALDFQESSGPGPRIDDRLLAALVAFVSGGGDFYKAEGGIRKKVLDEGNRIFPGTPWETLIEGLLAIGLLNNRDGRLIPDEQRFRFFQRLSFRGRMEYWAAGIFTALRNPDTPPLHRGRIQALTRLIHRVIVPLDPGRRYPLKTLRRLVELAEREQGGEVRWPDAGIRFPMIGAEGFEAFPRVLEMTGLLKPAGPGRWSPGEEPRSPESPEGPGIAMDSPFSFILYPEIPCGDALTLAFFSTVRETGTVIRFEITRDSVVRGFDLGLRAEEIIGHLERLSGGEPHQNLRWTITDWETRYSAVALHQGTVLTLGEDRRYLAQAEPLASLIGRVLAPGIYLLSAQDLEKAAQALEKAGIDIIARPVGSSRDRTGDSRDGPAKFGLSGYSPYPPLPPGDGEAVGAALRGPDHPEGEAEDRSPGADRGAAYQERFRAALGKLGLSKQEQDELNTRIDRRIILSESQLVGGAVRSEKMEAKNLDYVGKTMVAKQAISLKSFVEIHRISAGGELTRLFGIPEGLEKSGGDTLLVVKPISRNETPSTDGGEPSPESKEPETIRLPLGKILLLRRIKQSIFGE